MKKLHLGCGEKYLNGYINIDYPLEYHTIQHNSVADMSHNITELQFSNSEVDEIRTHHMFEHFERPVAIALLCRWSKWIKPSGLLHLETPDLMASAKDINSFWVSHNIKQQIIRHIFGSNEAAWAVHYDGWYKQKFINILSKLGFEGIKIKKNKYQNLRNIEVFAVRNNYVFSDAEYEDISKEILIESLITVGKIIPESEAVMLNTWLQKWSSQFYFDTNLKVEK